MKNGQHYLLSKEESEGEPLPLLPPAGIGIRVTSAPCKLGGSMIARNTNVQMIESPLMKVPTVLNRWSFIKRSAFEIYLLVLENIRVLGGTLPHKK